MISHLSPRFRKAYKRLPEHVRRQAQAAYRLWVNNPYHKSLRFKKAHPTEEIYSVRIGSDWRAIGIRNGDVIVWFWIGSHEEYNNLIG